MYTVADCKLYTEAQLDPHNRNRRLAIANRLVSNTGALHSANMAMQNRWRFDENGATAKMTAIQPKYLLDFSNDG